MFKKSIFILMVVALAACSTKPSNQEKSPLQQKVDEYARFTLTTDLTKLTPKEKEMLPLLIQAAEIMDELYWQQAWGDIKALPDSLTDSAAIAFFNINYGPWDRLDGNKPFVAGVGEKPAGANFYPADMTKEEFEALADPKKTDNYTVIVRKEDKSLEVIPYSVFYGEKLKKASELVLKASELAEDPGLKNYLKLRAEALLSNDYYPSDNVWMDMKDNGIDFVIGPIENYEDQLFGYKTSFESFVLVKDKEWSQKVLHFAALFPALQKSLPVDEKYKTEVPGSASDLGVYDVVYYAGDCNGGSKTIAINLPNDPRIHREKGTRKLQLKNAMQAKFEKILVPIAEQVLNPEQMKHVKFDAFFENVMFHESAHGLGITKTINGKGNVRDALKEGYTSIEEAKADILGLYLITKLNEMGEFKDKDLMDNYVTFVAGIFRSVRFGASSAHGKANMLSFNYLGEHGAFTRDASTGLYTVDFEKMKQAVADLSGMILVLQGNGDYEGTINLVKQKGIIMPELQKDLDKISTAGIPRDIVFDQGLKALGL